MNSYDSLRMDEVVEEDSVMILSH